MKAIVINRFGPPEVFEQAEIEAPEAGEREILIEVTGGSVNPVDWKQRKGNHRLLFGSRFPIVLGYDVAGKVVQTGNMASVFRVGDLVCGVQRIRGYGKGLAEFAKGPEICYAKLPEAEDPARFAVLSLTGLTALQALRDKGNIRKGDKVLIIGASGGVGHFAVQIAGIFGAEVFAVSSSLHLDFLKQFGDFHFIDYEKEDILKITDRFDIVFDCVGKYTFLKCRHLLNPGGTYINTLPRPKILIHKLCSVFTRGKKVRGVLMKHIPGDLKQLVSWVQEGKIRMCIDKEFPVREIARAHEYSEKGHTEGKILIRYAW